MKKVSFDFDDTLSYNEVQKYARLLIEQGIDVHVVTSRYEDPNRYPFVVINGHEDMFKIAEKLGIIRDNIHFTNMENKYHFFEKNPDFIWHLDNDEQELSLMKWETNTKTIGILFDYEYKKECNKLLNINQNEE